MSVVLEHKRATIRHLTMNFLGQGSFLGIRAV